MADASAHSVSPPHTLTIPQAAACEPQPAAPQTVPPPAAPSSVEHKSLALALLAAQRDAKEIVKDARNEGGPGQQAYNYATLPNVYEQARTTINAHGLALMHKPRMKELAGQALYVMETHLIHAKSGKSEMAEFPICRGWLPARQTGELMSYAERYNTLAILALAPKERDTDGEAAGRPASPALGATLPPETPAASSRRLKLIDGSGLIYRAFHGCPQLVTADGEPVGAVIGFCSMLAKLIEPEDERLAVAFDAGRRTFRHALDPDYKANRKALPDALAKQMPRFREAATAMGLTAIEMAGFEADDLLATYARAAAREGAAVTIVSSDKDLMQLIGAGIQLYDPQAEHYIDAQAVIDKLGAGPERATDAQALIGDAADNVPGCPGIGPVWAGELLAKFGSVEALIARADEIEPPAKREAILANAAQIVRSKQLVTLRDDVPLAGLPAWTAFGDGRGEAGAYLESLGPTSAPAPAIAAPVSAPARSRAEEGDPVFYVAMLAKLAKVRTLADLDRWLECCTMDALKRCTKVQRDSLRAEQARKRQALSSAAPHVADGAAAGQPHGAALDVPDADCSSSPAAAGLQERAP